jgi:hypothetical protein
LVAVFFLVAITNFFSVNSTWLQKD